MDAKRCSGPLHPDGKTLPIDQFYRNAARSDGLSGYCVECLTVINREIRLRNRAELLDVFGSICMRCGFDDVRALEVDHVDGGGRIERLTLKAQGRRFIEECRAHPEKYQLLCANCHAIKQHEAGEWKGNTVKRVPPTEKRQGIGRGNAPGQQDGIKAFNASGGRSPMMQKRWDEATPDQLQQMADKVRIAATGRRKVPNASGDGWHWSRPGDADYPAAATA